MMHPKLKKAIIVLHISAVLYFLVSIAVLFLTTAYFWLPAGDLSLWERNFLFVILIISSLMCIGTGIFVEFVVKGLKKRKYWSWVAGLILCGFYISSIFIVLGIIGLMGLLDEEVRTEFMKKKQ